VRVTTADGGVQEARALLDSGSEVTLVSFRLVKTLNVKTSQRVILDVEGVGVTTRSTREVDLTLSSIYPHHSKSSPSQLTFWMICLSHMSSSLRRCKVSTFYCLRRVSVASTCYLAKRSVSDRELKATLWRCREPFLGGPSRIYLIHLFPEDLSKGNIPERGTSPMDRSCT